MDSPADTTARPDDRRLDGRKLRWADVPPAGRMAGTAAARLANRRRSIDNAIQKIVERAPALTEQQLDRLRAILNTAPLPPR